MIQKILVLAVLGIGSFANAQEMLQTVYECHRGNIELFVQANSTEMRVSVVSCLTENCDFVSDGYTTPKLRKTGIGRYEAQDVVFEENPQAMKVTMEVKNDPGVLDFLGHNFVNGVYSCGSKTPSFIVPDDILNTSL